MGFSIAELIISIAILVIITSLILVNYGKFVETANLNQAVQSVASTIRKAQVYGISVQEYNGQFPPYGLHYNLNDSATSYILFADTDPSAPDAETPPGDGLYTAGGDSIIESYSVPAQGYIYQLCYTKKTEPSCAAADACCDLDGLDITFKRPAPDIYLYGIVGSGGAFFNNDVEIKVKSPRGSEKMIIIWDTGQIAVE